MLQPEEYKPKTVRLDDMPEDVYGAVIDIQAAAKLNCKCQRSMPWTIYHIIKEYYRIIQEYDRGKIQQGIGDQAAD